MSQPLDDAVLRREITAILQAQSDQWDSVTPRAVRYALEARLGYEQDHLLPEKKRIADAIKVALENMPAGAASAAEVKGEPSPPASFSALSAASPAGRTVEAQRSMNASKKRALSAAAGDDAEEDFLDEDEPKSKKPKQESKSPSISSSSSTSGGDPNTVQLGASKRIEVREFKGMILIDIRETYTDKTSGEERPGKKGIALKPEQWEALLKNAGKVNAAIERLRR